MSPLVRTRVAKDADTVAVKLRLPSRPVERHEARLGEARNAVSNHVFDCEAAYTASSSPCRYTRWADTFRAVVKPGSGLDHSLTSYVGCEQGLEATPFARPLN